MRSVAYVVFAALLTLALSLGLVLAPDACAETPAGPPRLERINLGEGEILRGIAQRRAQAKALTDEADALTRELVSSAAVRLRVDAAQLAEVKANDRGELAWVIAPAAPGPIAPVTTTTKK